MKTRIMGHMKFTPLDLPGVHFKTVIAKRGGGGGVQFSYVIISGALARAKRAQRSTMGNKIG